MLQLHKILINMVLVGVIMTGMTLFMLGGSSYYSTTDYDNSSFTGFDRLDNLENLTREFDSDDADAVNEDGLLDILGNFFTKMYASAKVFKESSNLLYDMTDDGVSQLPVGNTFSRMLKVALNIIFIILISVGIFLAFVTKSERT